MCRGRRIIHLMASVAVVVLGAPTTTAQTSALATLPPLIVRMPARSEVTGNAETARDTLARIRVQLAWLADERTFPCFLEAQGQGTSLIVRGVVPNETVRQHALDLARQASGLEIVNDIQIFAPPTPVPAPSLTAEELAEAARHHLKGVFGTRSQSMRVQAREGGCVVVTGFVLSLEEKLAVSRCLRQLKDCARVENQLVTPLVERDGKYFLLVSADGERLLPTDAPLKPTEPETGPNLIRASAPLIYCPVVLMAPGNPFTESRTVPSAAPSLASTKTPPPRADDWQPVNLPPRPPELLQLATATSEIIPLVPDPVPTMPPKREKSDTCSSPTTSVPRMAPKTEEPPRPLPVIVTFNTGGEQRRPARPEPVRVEPPVAEPALIPQEQQLNLMPVPAPPAPPVPPPLPLPIHDAALSPVRAEQPAEPPRRLAPLAPPASTHASPLRRGVWCDPYSYFHQPPIDPAPSVPSRPLPAAAPTPDKPARFLPQYVMQSVAKRRGPESAGQPNKYPTPRQVWQCIAERCGEEINKLDIHCPEPGNYLVYLHVRDQARGDDLTRRILTMPELRTCQLSVFTIVVP
ncbi:MAG: BON domain-containing protein [Gemmataceae bacterium]